VRSTRRLMSLAVLAAALATGAAACGSSGSPASSPGPAGSPSSAGAGTSAGTTPAATGPATATGDPLAALSADQIATRALADTKSAPSLHLTGVASDSGQSLTINVTLVRGKGCAGTLSEGKSGSFKLISNGTTVWALPDQQFYKSVGATDPAVLAILNGKYLMLKASDSGLAGMAAICSLSSLVGAFGTPFGLIKGAPTTIDGQPAVKLSESGDPDYLYVTDVAVPKLLQLNDPSSGGGIFNFSYPATTIAITPPPASEVLDGSKYGF
jgi:hypothetical protein